MSKWRIWGEGPDGTRLFDDNGVGYVSVINEENSEVARCGLPEYAHQIIADHAAVVPLRAACEQALGEFQEANGPDALDCGFCEGVPDAREPDEIAHEDTCVIAVLRLSLAEANARAEAVDVNAIRRVATALAALADDMYQRSPVTDEDYDSHSTPYHRLRAILADPAIRPYLPTGQAGLEQAGETP